MSGRRARRTTVKLCAGRWGAVTSSGKGAGLQNALEALVNEELTRNLRQSQHVQCEQRALERPPVVHVRRRAVHGLLLRPLLLVSLDLFVARIVALAAPPQLRRARSHTAVFAGRRLGRARWLQEWLHRLEQRVQLLHR